LKQEADQLQCGELHAMHAALHDAAACAAAAAAAAAGVLRSLMTDHVP
jgi:hypothetical protein